MYFDPVRSAYIDNESGEVVYVVEGEEARAAAAAASTTPRTTPSKSRRSQHSSHGKRSNAYYAGVVAAPSEGTYDFQAPDAAIDGDASQSAPSTGETKKRKHKHRHREERSAGGSETEAQRFERLFELAVMENQQKQRTQELADELYSLHVANAASNDIVLTPQDIELAGVIGDVNTPSGGQVVAAGAAQNPSYWDDWNFARTLQAMEFEIGDDDMQDDFDEDGEPITDFERKEYRASRSCRRQLMTISFFICVVQIALLIAMIQTGGYAPRSQNSVVGPPVYVMVRWGAKQTALIVDENEWFRLVAPIMLHAGIFHLIPNVAIQLRVGGYLNLVYGTPKWLWIYFASGIYGVICSCLFLPNAVGVGSSGALMGMLASWVVWIVFRWRKIPRRCHAQRNCQLGVVTLSIVVTLATSFMPNVDWAAHLGGAVMGVLFGVLLLTNELDNTRNQRLLRVAAGAVAAVLYAVSLWYLVAKLAYSTSSLEYWEANDDWD